MLHQAIAWYTTSKSEVVEPVCTTRDIFQARLDGYYREIIARHLLPEDETALLIAILGEIGNNCFDHNLGRWRGATGCWFSMQLDSHPVLAVIADQGQGVLNSLKHAKPDLSNEGEALKAAFELRISGRSPERRGNGLKFVRSVINGAKNRALLFWSGNTNTRFGGMAEIEKQTEGSKIELMKRTGTLALVGWSRP